jgi:hypothetical protein
MTSKTLNIKLDYRIKPIWTSNGTIVDPICDTQVISIFPTRTLSTQFTLRNLQPYTAYSFQLTAINSYGECKSDWSEDYYTEEELPRQQMPPNVLNYTSTSAQLEWKPPLIPNGIILYYRLNAFELRPQLVKCKEVHI